MCEHYKIIFCINICSVLKIDKLIISSLLIYPLHNHNSERTMNDKEYLALVTGDRKCSCDGRYDFGCMFNKCADCCAETTCGEHYNKACLLLKTDNKCACGNRIGDIDAYDAYVDIQCVNRLCKDCCRQKGGRECSVHKTPGIELSNKFIVDEKCSVCRFQYREKCLYSYQSFPVCVYNCNGCNIHFCNSCNPSLVHDVHCDKDNCQNCENGTCINNIAVDGYYCDKCYEETKYDMMYHSRCSICDNKLSDNKLSDNELSKNEAQYGASWKCDECCSIMCGDCDNIVGKYQTPLCSDETCCSCKTRKYIDGVDNISSYNHCGKCYGKIIYSFEGKEEECPIKSFRQNTFEKYKVEKVLKRRMKIKMKNDPEGCIKYFSGRKCIDGQHACCNEIICPEHHKYVAANIQNIKDDKCECGEPFDDGCVNKLCCDCCEHKGENCVFHVQYKLDQNLICEMCNNNIQHGGFGYKCAECNKNYCQDCNPSYFSDFVVCDDMDECWYCTNYNNDLVQYESFHYCGECCGETELSQKCHDKCSVCYSKTNDENPDGIQYRKCDDCKRKICSNCENNENVHLIEYDDSLFCNMCFRKNND